MLEKKFVRLLLCLVFVLSFLATAATGANILFVTADPTGLSFPNDALIKNFLEGLGHTVTYIDDNADEPTTEAAAAAADLVFISESVGSGNINREITEIATPMIITEAWAWDEMGLTNGGGTGIDVVSTDITIVKPDHFLAAGLPRSVPVLTNISGPDGIARFGLGLAGSSATVIATATLSDGKTYDVVFIYEKAASLAVPPADGSPQVAADIRICIGFDYRAHVLLNENAYELLAAAVNYALGITKQARNPRPGSGAKNVSLTMLQWSAGQTAKWHNVYLSTNPTLGAAELVSERQTGATYQPPAGFMPDTTYYWRVDEVQADGTTIHTGILWSFTTALLTACNPSPPDGAVYLNPSVKFSWTAGFGAVTHDVYLGTNRDAVVDATPSSPQFKANQSGTAYDPGPLAKGVTYYWRIDGVQADGTTKNKGHIWSFSTIPNIPISDPNLVGWWKLDYEGIDIVTDYSGYDNHSILLVNPQWVDGFDGEALAFDGTNFVSLPAGLVGTDKGSVCVWIKTIQAEDGMIFYGSQVTGGDGFGSQNEFHVNMRSGGQVEFFLEGGTASDVRVRTSAVNNDTWHHIGATWDINGNMTVYVDGGTPVSVKHNGNNFRLAGRIRLGAPDANQRYYIGLLDDVRLYNYVLAQDKIKETMKGDTRLASNPSPANRSAADIERAIPLSWSPGDKAAQHDVYFGTDRDAVANAGTLTTNIYRGRQAANSFSPPEGVEWGRTYYWRIDEVNTDATISKGRIWSFNVAEYLIVDDFEDYNDIDNRIFDVWADYFVNNTGATVGHFAPPFAEQTIVHEGKQSMPYRYDNDGTVNEGTSYEKTGTLVYSEADREWATPQDWTRKGVASLTLWFRGLPASVGSFTAGPPIRMTAGGADIWGTADQFHYAYKLLSGVGSIQVKVLSVSNTDPWAKAGVMIRESLAPGSTFAAVYLTPTTNGCRFQLRATSGGSATSDSSVATAEQIAIRAPYWVKLERGSGGRFNAYYSSNPATDPWHLMVWSPQIVTMSPDVYIGLALTSHNVNATCVAEFSDVTTTGTVTGQWQAQDIGIESNVADQLYVVLADSTNKSAVVKYPDPAATTIATWQQWNIDLAEFSGVNLQSIKKMSIGVGDRANPQRGSSGRLYIDDIRLYRSPSAQ